MVHFMSAIWNFCLNWAGTICIEKLNTFSLTVKIIYQGCICLNRSALRHVYRKHPYPSDHWSLLYISPDYTKKESIIIFKMYLKQHHAHKITSDFTLCQFTDFCCPQSSRNLLLTNNLMNNLQDIFHFLKDSQPITLIIKSSWNFIIILHKIYFSLT